MSSSSAAAPPFYWKVSAPEKDHMYENYRRIRHIGNQAQQKRNEPMKAAFIPGVTKNSKYSHVTSRVGESLRAQAQKSDEVSKARFQSSSSSVRSVPSNRYGANGRQNELPGIQTVTVTGAGGRRLSRSFNDVSIDPLGSDNAKRKGISASAGMVQPSRRRNQPLRPEEETVYNWRFSDVPSQPAFPHTMPQHERPKMCHRVEYLPCDGICADETLVDDKSNDSARSTASSRTSRGCNTEETRIIQDQIMAPGFFRQRSLSVDQDVGGNGDCANNDNDESDNDVPKFQKSSTNTASGAYTLNSPGNANHRTIATVNGSANYRPQFARSNSMSMPKPNKNNNSGDNIFGTTNTRANGSCVPSILKGSNQTRKDLPHNLGTVPKYLKQRQEEWKTEEEAKKEAARNAHIPSGHVLMTEPERLETLSMLKKNYDALILDLNRIPIRIDTIRVREHKIDLEKQLSKLEEAMRIFSRPRVFVKMDK